MEGVYTGTAVGIVRWGHEPTREFMRGLLRLRYPLSPVKLALAEQEGVDAARNELVRWFLNSDFLTLLLLDANVVVHPETLVRLKSWDAPIVSALGAPFSDLAPPVVLQPRPEDALERVGRVGMHCTLVDRDVFEEMPPPWFVDGVAFGPGLVDRSVIVGHETNHLVGLQDYAAYRIEGE